MARKERVITIKDRDNEHKFKLKEMSAVKAEKWKIRAIMLLLASDIEMPKGASIEEGINQFMAGGAEKLFKALSKVDVDKAIALFDEMLYDCAQLEVNGVTAALSEDIINSNIEDSSTLTKLRFECLKLHFDFLGVGASQMQTGLGSEAQIKIQA